MIENIALELIKEQVEDCKKVASNYGWEFSEIDEVNSTFTVRFLKSADNEIYKLLIQFDNFPKWPWLLDFIDEKTNEVGVKTAYPTWDDNFFNVHNNVPVICHPCSRKAYKGYTGLHADWGEYDGWRVIEQYGKIENLQGLLSAIYSRINSHRYHGRMEKHKDSITQGI